MHLSSVSRYALKLAYTQASVPSTSNAGERMAKSTAVVLAGLGLGLSSFSLKKMSGAPTRRHSLARFFQEH